ncbi:MAG: DUF445 family protein [Treponema sp.]|nr:DUF445 family protein [Treponema sp.]
MKDIIFFAVPPLVGAVIGFVTNVVAIRMLFRPLGEIRILGLRLPFTPGVLPRQRHRLALSIGAMVERELLTPEILRQRLAQKGVRDNIKKSFSVFTEKILASPPGDLFADNAGYLLNKIKQEAEKLYPDIKSSFMDFLRRQDIRRELESKGQVFLNNAILRLNVFQRIFLSAAQYDMTLSKKMPEIVDDLIVSVDSLLEDADVKQRLLKAACAAVERITGGQGKSIGGFLNLGAEDKENLDEFLLAKMLSALDANLEDLLASIDIKEMVRQRIDSLDMLRVERIILDVMADQFKWINIFGGILGFLIGLFQVFFNLLLR